MKIPMEEKLRKAMENIGGQPLRRSGFEDEAPEPEFSEPEPAEKTTLP